MTESLEGHPSDRSSEPISAPSPTPAPLESVVEQLVGETGDVLVSHHRLHRLMDASTEMTSELSVSVLLRRVLDSACELVDARYGALAVLGPDGTLAEFLQVGMDAATVAAIGDLPKRHGLLGALTDDPKPIRLARIADDERSVGFPIDHPAMQTFLGLGIRSRGKVLGSLYLADRHGGEFTIEDEELLTAFAATAGLAIQNAQLDELAQGGQRRLQASAEISGMLLARDSGSDPLQVILEKVCQLVGADMGTLVLPSPQLDQFEVAVATGSGADRLRGMTYPAADSMVRQAMESGRGVRVASVEHQHRFEVHLSQVAEVGPVMALPMAGRSGPQGALMVGRRAGREAFTLADLNLAMAFATHAAVARDLADARADQQRLAVLKERARIARDLHDHVIQRLFAAGLTMQSMAATAAMPELTDRLDSVIGNINDTIRQIRTSIFQLQDSDSAPSGVRSIVLEIIDQISPALGFMPTVRFIGPLDTIVAAAELDAVAAVVREGVTNVAKHAQATALDVVVRVDGNELSVDLSDNGIGLGRHDDARRSGLDNLLRRADIWGGTLNLTENEPHGTRLLWTIPLP